MMTQLLNRRVASDAAVARFGQMACFAAACLIPVLAFRRFSELELSEYQLLVGVVATVSLALLCTVLGLFLESNKRAA